MQESVEPSVSHRSCRLKGQVLILCRSQLHKHCPLEIAPRILSVPPRFTLWLLLGLGTVPQNEGAKPG